MRSSQQKNLIATVAAILVILIIVGYILKRNDIKPGYAIIPVLLVLIFSLPYILSKKGDNDSESYTVSSTESGGCSQTINIVQNCGPNPPSPPSPPPSPPHPPEKEDILDWIDSIDSELTSSCKNCIVNSASKLWSRDMLPKVKQLSKEQQKNILNALLSFDCSKQCVVTPAKLTASVIQRWVSVLLPKLPQKCINCVVSFGLKLWTLEDFAMIQAKDKEDQINLVNALIAMNCNDCADTPRIDPGLIRKWLDSVLAGAKPDCMDCIVDKISAMWTLADFGKVQGMDKKSQLQIVQALIGLACSKECVYIPSGLNRNVISQWVNSVLTGENPNCLNCVVNVISKVWSPSIFNNVKSKPVNEQVKVLQSIIAANCLNECVSTPLSSQQVLAWIRKIFPKYSKECQECIVEHAMKMWNKSDFNELLSKPTSDQAKVAKLIADYNCPDLCVNEPYKDCDFLPY